MTDPANPADQPDRTDIDRTQRLLGKRFQLSWIIGRGGMSTVWLARDTEIGRDVAVKILKPEFTENREFRERFRNEADSAEHFQAENVVATYDYGEVADQGSIFCYIIMEYVQGETLADILLREKTLPEHLSLDLIGQTALGLATIHKAGLVHRDIKPGNLLITPDGLVKITDFGIAKAAEAVPLTQTGMVVGTAQYVSPEQAQGQTVTAASDVYSLGVVAYEVLSGQRPFRGDSSVSVAIKHISEAPAPLPEELSPDVRELVSICLRKKPETRYADGQELAQATALVEAGERAPRPHLLPPLAEGHPLTEQFGQANDGNDELADFATGRGTAVPPRQGPASQGAANQDPAPSAAQTPRPTQQPGPQAAKSQAAKPQPTNHQADSRKSARALWITFAVLVILAAGVAGYLLVANGKDDKSPDKETTTVTNEVTTETSPEQQTPTVTREPSEPVQTQTNPQGGQNNRSGTTNDRSQNSGDNNSRNRDRQSNRGNSGNNRGDSGQGGATRNPGNSGQQPGNSGNDSRQGGVDNGNGNTNGGGNNDGGTGGGNNSGGAAGNGDSAASTGNGPDNEALRGISGGGQTGDRATTGATVQ